MAAPRRPCRPLCGRRLGRDLYRRRLRRSTAAPLPLATHVWPSVGAEGLPTAFSQPLRKRFWGTEKQRRRRRRCGLLGPPGSLL
eukprot:4751480-Pyramimonas_sp.AAC.1